MHYPKWLLLFLLALLVTCGDRGSSEQARAEVEGTVRKFHARFDQKSFSGMAALCTEDMRWYTLNGQVLEKSQFMNFFLPMMRNWRALKTTPGDMEIRVSGDLAVARYPATFEFESPRGENRMENLHTMVLVRVDSQWKIWQHHMSTSY